MSMPLTLCMIFRAARDEDGARAKLKEIVEYNKKHGAFTFRGCKHDPRCTATEEELLSLFLEQRELALLLDQILPDPPK